MSVTIEEIKISDDAGVDTNMGPVSELSDISSNESGSDEDIEEEAKKESGDWKQPSHEVNMGDGEALMLWSSAEDDTSGQADDDMDATVEAWKIAH